MNNSCNQNFFKTTENVPGFLLWHLTNIWQRFMKIKLEEVDLTHVQFAIMKGLFIAKKDNKSFTQVELAHHLDMNTMMVSQVLRTLEKKDFVHRVPHIKDTRAKCLELTTEGEKHINKAFEIMRKANVEFFLPIEKDLDKAIDILKKLIEENEKKA